MKTLIIASGIVIVMGVALELFYNKGVEVINQVETVTETVTVDALEERIKKAQDAAQADTEEAAQRAYNALYEEKMKEVEDRVKAEYIAEIEATITSEAY